MLVRVSVTVRVSCIFLIWAGAAGAVFLRTQLLLISILDILNKFINTRLTVKSRDGNYGMFLLDKERTSKPYRKIGIHFEVSAAKYLF